MSFFLFIGADPATQWLQACGVLLDSKGFVRTGSGLAPDEISSDGQNRMPLESSVTGVFAAGDVRSGSVKRVGAAIGEGATVVAQLHSYLEATSSNPRVVTTNQTGVLMSNDNATRAAAG
jgi:thioredoxin reductase (NADPH)